MDAVAELVGSAPSPRRGLIGERTVRLEGQRALARPFHELDVVEEGTAVVGQDTGRVDDQLAGARRFVPVVVRDRNEGRGRRRWPDGGAHEQHRCGDRDDRPAMDAEPAVGHAIRASFTERGSKATTAPPSPGSGGCGCVSMPSMNAATSRSSSCVPAASPSRLSASSVASPCGTVGSSSSPRTYRRRRGCGRCSGISSPAQAVPGSRRRPSARGDSGSPARIIVEVGQVADDRDRPARRAA